MYVHLRAGSEPGLAAIAHRSLLIATVVVVVTAVGPNAIEAADAVDQAYTYPNPAHFGSILTGYAYGQTFTPALNSINFARFYFRPMGSPVDLAVDLHEYRFVGGEHDEHAYVIVEPPMATSAPITVANQGVGTFHGDVLDLLEKRGDATSRVSEPKTVG